MLRRTFALATVVALVAWAVPVYGEEEEKTHEGKVVKVDGTKLTMSDKDGKNEHTHTIPADAKITLDGKDAKLADLKAGMSVKVTAEKKDNKVQVTKIEAKKAD